MIASVSSGVRMRAGRSPTGSTATRTPRHGFAAISSYRSDSRRTTRTATSAFRAAAGVRLRGELVDQALDVAAGQRIDADAADSGQHVESKRRLVLLDRRSLVGETAVRPYRPVDRAAAKAPGRI